MYKFHERKPKKFFFNLDDKQYLYNNEVRSALSAKDILTNQIKKVNIPLEKIVSLPELQKKVAKMVSNVFLCILGDIQYRLAKFHNNTEQDELEIREIAVPPHLKSCMNLRNQEDENENSKLEEEEEEEEKSVSNNKIENNNKITEKSVESKQDKESSGRNDKKSGSDIGKEMLISNKISEGDNLINNDDKLKNKKSEITDLTDVTKNNNKNISKEENNEEKENSSDDLDDLDDMDFDMNEEEHDTHYPKYFIKDKSIIQLNDYPDSMKEFNNKIIDSQNAFD